MERDGRRDMMPTLEKATNEEIKDELSSRGLTIPKVITCLGCNRDRFHIAKGYCSSCYSMRGFLMNAERVCGGCHIVKPHYALGKCRACYATYLRYPTGVKRPQFRRLKGSCLRCEKVELLTKTGYCQLCQPFWNKLRPRRVFQNKIHAIVKEHKQSLLGLSDKQRYILVSLDIGENLSQIGKHLGITREAVRQSCNKAILRLVMKEKDGILR